MIGQTLLQYRVLERLGVGGMGEVYLAEDRRLGRKVALKVLPARLASQPLHLERFRREARAAAALTHPNIVTIYSVEEADGLPILTMELVEGKTLADLIPPEGLEIGRLLDIAVQIADALAAAHQHGIIHRDIKPRNLMVDTGGRVKILDFGIAKRLLAEDAQTVDVGGNTALTQEGQIIGTIAYMSPEQLRNQPLDPRSDLFSFGVVLYEMATGHLPFQGSTPADQMVAILHLRPQWPGAVRSGLPPRFDEIVARCLERDMQRRYQRAHELRDNLELLRFEVRSGTHSSPTMAAGGFHTAGLQALAVLPFENLSGEEEYFVNGMTDALISSLSHLGRVRVISRQSVMRYKGSDKPLPVIARELGVDVVLTGSVLRAGSRVRITTQLVQAEPEQQLWAELYNRDTQDVLALQDEVVREVAGQVRLELTEQESSRLMDARRVNPEVYELYLQGRFHWDKRTPEGLRKAVEYFEKAIAADPFYAAAHAGLADAYALLAYFRHEPREEAFGKARAAASRALALDPSLAEAHGSLGFVLLFHDWDGPGAERGFRRAIELNPSYATAHHWLWGCLSSVGRLREAGQHLRIARQLNPFSPTINAAAAAQSRMLRDFPLSIEQAQKAIDLEPGYTLSHEYLWMALHLQGRYEEAFQVYQRALTLWDLPEVAERARRTHARSGYRTALFEVAEALAAEAETGSEKAPVHVITETYALADATREAIAWLERGVAQREPFVIWLRQLPELDSLRDSPRFQELSQLVDHERFRDQTLL